MSRQFGRNAPLTGIGDDDLLAEDLDARFLLFRPRLCGVAERYNEVTGQ